MEALKALREEFAKTHTDTQKIITAAAKENRPLSAEEKQQTDRMFARMDEIKAIADAATRLAKFSLENDVAVQTPASPAGKAAHDAIEGNAGDFMKADGSFDLMAYQAAANHFARTGNLAKAGKFAVTTATDSGIYLPSQVTQPTQVRRLPNALRALLAHFGLNAISIQRIATVKLPVEDDTANIGQAQSQSATSGTELDASDAGITLDPTLHSSKQSWWSNSTVLAQDFDIFQYVVPMLNKRLDKYQESAWVSNLKTNATVGVTTAATTTFTYAEWISFEHSLGAAYRVDAGFIVADTALAILRGLTDDNNRPIMDLDPTNQFQERVHGKPVIVSDYMDAVAAAKVIAAFASAEAIKILDAGMRRIVRYQSYPAKPDQTGYEIFANGDSDFVPAGVRTLKTHA